MVFKNTFLDIEKHTLYKSDKIKLNFVTNTFPFKFKTGRSSKI